MPNTYYKYKERDADSQINWAQVGADVTKMLTNEAQSREAKKAAIDKATKESLELMRNAPTGESVTLQEAAINYSDEVTQSMLNAERLLKSGVMKPRDYAIYQQNLNDGTEQAFSLYQEYQNAYADKMARFQNGESSAGEVWMMENVEGYADLSQAKFTHDPTTGKVVAIGPDGQPRSVSSLKRQMTTKIDKYQVDATTQDWINMNGSWVDMGRTIGSRTRAGSITKSIDPTLKQLSEREIAELGLSAEDGASLNLYMQAETDYVESIVNGPNAWNAASILTDHVGGYEFTRTEGEAGGNKILLVPNEQGGLMPQLTEEQKKKAMGQLRIAIRNKVDKTEDVSTVNDWQRPSAEQEAAGRANQNKKKLATVWNNLYYAQDASTKNDLLQSIMGDDMVKDAGVTNLKFAPDGSSLIVEYIDSRKNRTIPISANPTPEEWAGIGSEIHGVSDRKEALRLGGGMPSGATWSPNFTGVGAARTGATPEVDYMEEALTYVATKANQNSDLLTKKDDIAAAKLQEMYGSLGFTFEPNSSINPYNEITVTAPDGSTLVVKSNEDTDGAEAQLDALQSFINGKLTKENAETAYKAGNVRGSGGGGGELD